MSEAFTALLMEKCKEFCTTLWRFNSMANYSAS